MRFTEASCSGEEITKKMKPQASKRARTMRKYRRMMRYYRDKKAVIYIEINRGTLRYEKAFTRAEINDAYKKALTEVK